MLPTEKKIIIHLYQETDPAGTRTPHKTINWQMYVFYTNSNVKR